MIGILLNIGIALQAEEYLFLIGNLPVILVFSLRLAENHKLFLEQLHEIDTAHSNNIEKILWRILKLKPLQKFSILLILSLPILVLLASILLIVGQKPDSIIRAFTETYKQGLSKLDCTNVNCPDGHFLCTIAASGHEQFVKPTRIGIRHGYLIKANRQLLISNAFEDLLEEKIPWAHRPIRRCYNIIGGNFRKLYDVLGNKWIADFVYICMKPLEIFFLVVLYSFDRKPENRIATQYISKHDRELLKTIK